jgi:general secretion pathway protein A
MYLQHFGLKESPFSIAPDPRYLFMSEQHREALAHLLYGINTAGGFVLLTGDVGTGKTTVSRCLLDQIPENVNIALILNPKVTVEELLATVCDELQIPYPYGCASVKVFVDAINSFLLDAHARGRKTVLLIDEAQNLSPDVLEQIRLLTNLETNQQKLLQIIMIGQPELRELLSRPDLSQLSQRITARYHMGPLSREDVALYVNHRLFIAGAKQDIFPVSVMKDLHRLSHGIPRMINVICDRALLGTYVQGTSFVDRKTLIRAAEEVLGNPEHRHQRRSKWMIAVVLILICVTAFAAALYYQRLPVFSFAEKRIPEENIGNVEQLTPGPLEWPAGESFEQSRQRAYQALFHEWGMPESVDMIPNLCEYMQAKGLRCLEQEGDLRRLQVLNRPAVLTLSDDVSGEYCALLIKIQGETAVVVIGSDTRTVPLSEIEKRWRGKYFLLWRAPGNYAGSIYPGSQAPIVRWIDRQMSVINGIADKTRPADIYHEELVRQVKQFQAREGLDPDGVVGSQTVIAILNKTGTNEPRLLQ